MSKRKKRKSRRSGRAKRKSCPRRPRKAACPLVPSNKKALLAVLPVAAAWSLAGYMFAKAKQS